MNEADPVEQPPAEPPSERRYPSTIGGAFYLLILGVVTAGIIVGALDEWRLGVRIMGGAMIGAGFLRLVLPQRDAGMLAVRHRFIDVLVLALMGVALIFLAGDIPGRAV